MVQNYFYTETAFIHQGDIKYLMDLVKVSAMVGANGIKFQVIGDYEDFISRVNPNYGSFKKAMIKRKDWDNVFRFAKDCGLDIIYMPCDKKAAQLANTVWHQKISYLDIHPVNFNYLPILNIIKESTFDLILGVGGRQKDEIDKKIIFFGNKIRVLMFGHQAFPTEFHQSAIGKIVLLRETYPHLIIGYADHSRYDNIWARHLHSVAYMLGARCFEKHISVREGEERFDYLSSSDGKSIQLIIDDLNKLASHEMELPDLNTLNKSELKYTSRQVKAVASRDMRRGERISENDINYKMIESEQGLEFEKDPTGKILTLDIRYDFPFTEAHINNE